MSASVSPQPTAPVAGATQGMPAPPANPIAQEFQQVVVRVKALMEHLAQSPQVDQDKLRQGRMMLGQAVTMIAAAVTKQGGPPGGGAPPGPPGQ